MKKCPYCKTFMNDDVNMCPNCLKDMSNLRSMPEISPKTNKKSFNLMVYGLVLGAGGILASLSQGINKKGYQEKYDALAETIKTMADGNEKEKLINDALEYMTRINECAFREIAFIVVSAIGVGLLVLALVLFIKNRKNIKGEN